MSQPIQTVEDTVPLTIAQSPADTQLISGLRRLKTPFRVLTGLFLSPLLVIVAVLGFVVVLADFAFFRLRDIRDGHPQPKALWEF